MDAIYTTTGLVLALSAMAGLLVGVPVANRVNATAFSDSFAGKALNVLGFVGFYALGYLSDSVPVKCVAIAFTFFFLTIGMRKRNKKQA